MSDQPDAAQYQVPEWPEIIDFARSSIVAASRYLALASRSEAKNRDIVCAATARCVLLIEGIITLIESGAVEMQGVVLRTVYESWLVGTYAQLGSEVARSRLVDQYNFELTYLLKELSASIEEIPEGREFKIWEYAKSLKELLEERSHPQANFSVAAYNTLYRFESLYSIHAGIGSIGLVVSDDDHETVIRRDPPSDASNRHRFLLGASLMLALARSVAVLEGLDYSDSDVLENWIVSLRPD